MSINMLTFSAMPLMAYPLGAIADHLGARETFTLQGLVIISAMLFAAVANRGYTFGRQEVEARDPTGTAGQSPAAASSQDRANEAALP
jgi:hypothetical protein